MPKLAAEVTKGLKKVEWLSPGPACAKNTAARTLDFFAVSSWEAQVASSCMILVSLLPPTRLIPTNSTPFFTKAKFSGRPVCLSVAGVPQKKSSNRMKYFTHRFQPDDGLEQSMVSLSPGTM